MCCAGDADDGNWNATMKLHDARGERCAPLAIMHVRVADVDMAASSRSPAANRANVLVSPSQLRGCPAGAVPPHQFPAPAPLARHCPLSRRYRLRSMISTSAPDVPLAGGSLTSPAARRAGPQAARPPQLLDTWCSAAVQQQTEHHVWRGHGGTR